MGLTPKHRKPFVKKNWEELNKTLKSNIDDSDSLHPSIAIELDEYQMSKEEIINELKHNGYSVEDHHNGYLVIS